MSVNLILGDRILGGFYQSKSFIIMRSAMIHFGMKFIAWELCRGSQVFDFFFFSAGHGTPDSLSTVELHPQPPKLNSKSEGNAVGTLL